MNNKEKLVPSKYHCKYPLNSERDYVRVTNIVTHILKETIEENIGAIKAAINDGTRFDSAKDNQRKRQSERMTSITRTTHSLESIFDRMKKEISRRLAIYDIKKLVVAISQRTQKLSVNEFKKACKKTLGIDIRDDVFTGSQIEELIEKWVSENVELIKSIPYDALDDVKKTVIKNYFEGNTTTSILQEIQYRYGVTKRRARLIARDQVGKLNGEITKNQQSEAGCKYYQWDTSGDKRVRKEHQELDGKIFSWDNSHPATNKKGEIIWPGKEIQCRCVSLPVFDLDNIPWEIPKEKESRKLS